MTDGADTAGEIAVSLFKSETDCSSAVAVRAPAGTPIGEVRCRTAPPRAALLGPAMPLSLHSARRRPAAPPPRGRTQPAPRQVRRAVDVFARAALGHACPMLLRDGRKCSDADGHLDERPPAGGVCAGRALAGLGLARRRMQGSAAPPLACPKAECRRPPLVVGESPPLLTTAQIWDTASLELHRAFDIRDREATPPCPPYTGEGPNLSETHRGDMHQEETMPRGISLSHASREANPARRVGAPGV